MNIRKIIKEEINKPSESEFKQAIQDVRSMIPMISHRILKDQGLEPNEENIVKLNKEILQKVINGDDTILDEMWNLAGSMVVKHAINVITYYTKIIKEEMDDFDWVKDIPTGIELKPNTMYYFEPKADSIELNNFVNGITNSPHIKSILEKRKEQLSYFVTANNVNELWGWCSVTDPFEAKEELYNNEVNMVDVRKTFGGIL